MHKCYGQRRNEGEKMDTIPRAPSNCGGRRKVPTMSQILFLVGYSTCASKKP